MKNPFSSRTLVATGLALTPVAWLLTGCGGGGGGGNSNGTPNATATPTTSVTRTPTPVVTPGATATSTPIPTPTVPAGGQRFLSPVDLGNGQIGILNLVINRVGLISGIITVPPVAEGNTSLSAIQPGTFRVLGQYSLPNNFRFAGALRTVGNQNLPFSAVGKTAANGVAGSITVTVGSQTFPTQNF